MVKCEYCGNEYYNNEKYCESCGAALKQVKEPTNSAQSGNKNDKPKVVNQKPIVVNQSKKAQPINTTQQTGQFIVWLFISVFILVTIISTFSYAIDDGDDYSYTDDSSDLNVDYVDDSVFKYTSDDYGLYSDFDTKFQANPTDAEAVEYLLWYYLDKEEPSKAYEVMDIFLAQEVRDDSQIYIDMANVFIGFELYGNAYMILDRGYELTNLKSIATYIDEIDLMNNYQDTQMGDILEMMFHKNLDLITYDDLSQIKAVVIEEDGMVISYSKEEPEIVDGYIKDFENYESKMDTITLSEYLYQETNFDVFPELKAFRDERIYVDLDVFPYYYDLRFLSIRSGSSSDKPIEKIPTMPKLQGLCLNGSNFNAINNIESLEALELLQLSYTEVSNITKLKELPNLKTIMLNDNSLIQSTYDIAEIESLKHLYVEDMETVAIELNTEKVKLESLSIVNTEVRNVDFIGNCTELTTLEIYDNSELTKIPKLSGLTKLERLRVQAVDDIEGYNTVSFVKGLTNLKYLYVEGGVKDVGPIGTLTNLEELIIYGDFGYLDSNMSELGALTKLQRLTLLGRSYDDYIDLSFLSKTKNVTYLDLMGAEYIMGDSIFTLPNLKELHLSGFIGNFSNISKLQSLEILTLNSMTIMEDIAVEYDGGFTYVYYVGESELSDFSGSLKQLTNLKSLSVSGNELDNVEFARSLTNLERFIINDNYVTDLEPISGLSNLKYLSVVENPISNWGGLKEKADIEIVTAYE